MTTYATCALCGFINDDAGATRCSACGSDKIYTRARPDLVLLSSFSVDVMKDAIARAGMATGDLADRPRVVARYAEAKAFLDEANNLLPRRRRFCPPAATVRPPSPPTASSSDDDSDDDAMPGLTDGDGPPSPPSLRRNAPAPAPASALGGRAFMGSTDSRG